MPVRVDYGLNEKPPAVMGGGMPWSPGSGSVARGMLERLVETYSNRDWTRIRIRIRRTTTRWSNAVTTVSYVE